MSLNINTQPEHDITFIKNMGEIDHGFNQLVNLLRWGYCYPVKIELDEPLIRKTKVIEYLLKNKEFVFDKHILFYDDRKYHPYGDSRQCVVIVDETTDPEFLTEIDKFWKAVKEEQAVKFFTLPNVNHHVYRIYVDNRPQSRGIILTRAEIIDDSYDAEKTCNCQVCNMSDVDTDVESLFNSDSEE